MLDVKGFFDKAQSKYRDYKKSYKEKSDRKAEEELHRLDEEYESLKRRDNIVKKKKRNKELKENVSEGKKSLSGNGFFGESMLGSVNPHFGNASMGVYPINDTRKGSKKRNNLWY